MAYKKTKETEEILKTLEKNAEKTDFEKIRCPHCNWSPDASSRWFCADCDAPEYFYGGCYTSWNTFETRGRCPTCAHQWIWTSCLRCAGWSRHEDWYAIKKING
jgi:hypothetical protein